MPAFPALPLIIDALAFAAHKHRDQRRKDKGASPYINHPVTLAHILVLEGGVTDPIAIAGALLHDTVEDTDTSYEELVAQFGQKVADVVMEAGNSAYGPGSHWIEARQV